MVTALDFNNSVVKRLWCILIVNFLALIAEQFLERTASQLTYHGLYELNTHVKEDELAVFFRNNHFTTLYRNKVSLFIDYGEIHSYHLSRGKW